jgi:hypothetical protein
MISKKSQKIANVFLCDSCMYKCSNKYDYNKHLLTVKHKMVIDGNKKSQKIVTAHICECGKKYKYVSGLSRHKNVCSLSGERCPPTTPSPRPLASLKAELYSNSAVIAENPEEKPSMMDFITQNKEIMDMLVLQNKEMVIQNKEQAVLIKEQSETIRELIPKIGNNNTTTNNNNNQFNLQVFLNEDCKEAVNFSDFIETIKVSFADLENQAENGYIKGISKLFIENLQNLGINKRPIHCTDRKRKTLYIKENDTWDKEGSQDVIKKGIQEVSKRTFGELIKSKEDNAEAYKDADSEFSEKCISIQRSLVPNYPRETTINKVIEIITQNTGLIEK